MLRKDFVNKNFIYLIFIFIGLNLKITSGLYIYNILIFLFIAFNYKTMKLQKDVIVIVSSFMILNLIVVLIQMLFYSVEVSSNSVYLVYNLILFVSFLIFIKFIKFDSLNINFLLFTLSFPLILSILMFHFNLLESFILNLYHLEKYPAFGRYGGVFGRDVNALGIYGSLVLIATIVLRSLKLISTSSSIIYFIISLYAIVLSGMRTGILVFVGLAFIYQYRLKVLNYKYIISIFLLLFVSIFIIYNTNETAKDLIDFFLIRFSPSYLIQSAGIGNPDHSNLQTAINYFIRTLGTKEVNFYNILTGIDYNLVFVDNFYIFVFLKFGLLIISFIVLTGIYLLKKSFDKRDYIVTYFILASFTIALKGIFIINNAYMFMILFIIFIWRYHENTYSRR